ncbi:MAG: PQQ-binding-like beta-propeller repeat protein [Chthonomonadales bacterium]|nr:PQQ-binding-like beta-propeller repeat protein [Chthonomonadales bacterium]
MRCRLMPVIVLAWCVSGVRAENWPQFRGPTGQGISSERGLPAQWNATEGVRWKAAVPGSGWWSPIVWGRRVFLTTTTDAGASCRVLCFSADDGGLLWNREVFRQQPGQRHGRNSYATPTPATDGRRVYAVFWDGSVAAVNFDGTVAWINRDHPHHSEHGLSSSPILVGDLLVMARDGSSEGPDRSVGWQTPWDKAALLALDKNSGKVRWIGRRGMSRIAHAVPVAWTDEKGVTQIVSVAGDVVQGFDPRTGERLWSSRNTCEGLVPSPAVGGGMVFTASGFGGAEATRAYRLGGTGDLEETNLVWSQQRGTPKVPSLLYVAPYVYTVSDTSLAVCLEAATGKIMWEQRLGGSFSASPVYADGRIYFLSDQGDTTVVEAGPTFKQIAKNPLGERCQASPAISGGRIFIRTESSLFCIGK